MLAHDFLGQPIADYEEPPSLRVTKEPGKPPLWLVETEDGDELACLSSKDAASRMVHDLDAAIRSLFDGAPANDVDASPDLDLFVGQFIHDPADVHLRYLDDYRELLNPEGPCLPAGVSALDGANLMDLFDDPSKGGPYPKQRQFVLSLRRFCMFLAGRGTGKSRALGIKAFMLAFWNPGVPGMLLSRSYNELHSVVLPYFWDCVNRFKEATGIDVIARYNKSLQILTLINGSTIFLRSWDRVDRVRSYTVGWVCIDEIEHGSADPMYALNTVHACLRHPGTPYPQICIATTPNGLTGVSAHFKNVQGDGDPDAMYHVTHAATIDNPYLPGGFAEAMRLSMSDREWKQEGLGLILGPRAQVFVEYDERRHLIDWEWDDELPYMMAVDWGTSHAYACAVQYRERPGTYGYEWVVAWERKWEDVGPMDVRRGIEEFIKRRGYQPELVVGDRAKPDENNWVRGRFREARVLSSADTKAEADIARGINMVRFMLDPPEGPRMPGTDRPRPLLLFARRPEGADPKDHTLDGLHGHLHKAGRGLLGAFVNLRYKQTMEGVLTNRIWKDDLNDHPIDAIRYLVRRSAHLVNFHGGRPLRCLYPAELRLAS